MLERANAYAHLKTGVRPLIASVVNLANSEEVEASADAIGQIKSGGENVDFFASPGKKFEKGQLTKPDSEQSYVISTIGTTSKFTEKSRNCLTAVISGMKKSPPDAGKRISMMMHINPSHTLMYRGVKGIIERNLMPKSLRDWEADNFTNWHSTTL